MAYIHSTATLTALGPDGRRERRNVRGAMPEATIGYPLRVAGVVACELPDFLREIPELGGWHSDLQEERASVAGGC